MIKKVLLALAVIGIMMWGAYTTTRAFQSQNTEKEPATLAATSQTPENIPAVIIPHINASGEKRLEALKEVSTRIKPSHLILASVNHQALGDANVAIYPQDWQVQGGAIKQNRALYDNVVSNNLAISDTGVFLDEHGIKNVLSDVHAAFPEADCTSIIIKDTANKSEISGLVEFFEQHATDTLFIGSVDFSHYNPRNLANIHDDYSIGALSNLDLDAIWRAETDSPQILTLAARLARDAEAKNFNLYARGNSADFLANDDMETTSYVLGYYSSLAAGSELPKTTTFTFAGDMMYDREIWHTFKTLGLRRIFDHFGSRVFRGSDIAFANNEGPISDTAITDDYSPRSMSFEFPPETIDVLKYLGLRSVSLANNHSLNAGSSTFAATRQMLSDAGIMNIGQQKGFDSTTDILRVDGGVPTSIVAIDALETYNENVLESSIAAEKAAGRFVIVYPHWGTEYETTHSASQEKLARSWIAAGAGMIIGSHPHVVQDFQIINGVPVAYSLGNFVFDQYFSNETQHGLLLSGVITEKNIRLTFLPTQQKSFKPEVLQGADKQNDLAKILDITSQNGFKKLGSDTIEIDR